MVKNNFLKNLKLAAIKRFLKNNGVESSTAWIAISIAEEKLLAHACSATGTTISLFESIPLHQAKEEAALEEMCQMFASLLNGHSNTYLGAMQRYINTPYTAGFVLRMYVNGVTSHVRV